MHICRYMDKICCVCVYVCVCVDTHTQVSQRDFNERLGAIGYSKDPNTVFGDLAYLRAETYEANVREMLSKVFFFFFQLRADT
jgi:hypothetical protein